MTFISAAYARRAGTNGKFGATSGREYRRPGLHLWCLGPVLRQRDHAHDPWNLAASHRSIARNTQARSRPTPPSSQHTQPTSPPSWRPFRTSFSHTVLSCSRKSNWTSTASRILPASGSEQSRAALYLCGAVLDRQERHENCRHAGLERPPNEELWAIVAFLKKLPGMTEQDYAKLVMATMASSEHDHSGSTDTHAAQPPHHNGPSRPSRLAITDNGSSRVDWDRAPGLVYTVAISSPAAPGRRV
jgi:hypothetical protein